MTETRRSNRRQIPATWGEIAGFLPGGSALIRRLQIQKIIDSWNNAVGKAVAEQTRPRRVRDGVLEVNVGNSVWMQQLQFMKGLILKKLDPKGVQIREIRFFIGDIAGEPGEEGREEPVRKHFEELPAAEKERIAREVAHLPDPEMREIMSRVFARSLAAEKYRRK